MRAGIKSQTKPTKESRIMRAFRPFLIVIGVCAAIGATHVATAEASPSGRHSGLRGSYGVSEVSYRGWGDDYGYRHRYHGHRRYYGGDVVDAPYTHVEPGRVVVDAPFTHVYSGPRGRHIVAPFVDLWVPY
jgi:hypothetical protein